MTSYDVTCSFTVKANLLGFVITTLNTVSSPVQPWVPGGPSPGQSSGGIGFNMPSHQSALSTGYPPTPQGTCTPSKRKLLIFRLPSGSDRVCMAVLQTN